ncbi:hypothetical protein OUZ56_033074 [Daphnia magna]|uniref:Uncharacterized protein n=1 Tax=Daphnia magna TaxID=35525 RepID=A0ABQ9ZXD5_9CRUS|nr:hypothetical protein OUZ56_033074 [Daphnia magna]
MILAAMGMILADLSFSFNVRPLSIDRFLMKANLKKIHCFDCQLSKAVSGELELSSRFGELVSTLLMTLDSDSDTTYNGVCSTLLNNCEEGTLTEIGHQEDAEHSTPGGLTHTINQK